MMQSRLWSASWSRKRAVYPVIGAIVVLTLTIMVGHDGELWYQVTYQGGEPELIADTFFPFTNHQQTIIVGTALFGLMIALIGLAIFIRIAQHHHASNYR